MKFLKMTQTSTVEFAIPIDDASEAEIAEMLSDEGRKAFNDEARTVMEAQASQVGGKVLSCQLTVEVIDI